VIEVLLLGATAGCGLWCMVLGLFPARQSLAQGLARLQLVPIRPPIIVAATARPGALSRAGSPLAQLLLRRSGPGTWRWLSPHWLQANLTVVGRTMERHLAEKVGTALLGLLFPPVVAGLLALAGVALPVAIPLWVALVFGVGGFVLPDYAVRSQAALRRREFRGDLAAFVQVTALSLTAANGLETAIGHGANAGSSWGFGQIRSALTQVTFTEETPWTALARLGAELGIDELEELAARVSLAGRDAAQIQASLATYAQTLRARRLAEVEADEKTATEKMTAAGVMLLIGFTLFLVLPGFSLLFSSH